MKPILIALGLSIGCLWPLSQAHGQSAPEEPSLASRQGLAGALIFSNRGLGIDVMYQTGNGTRQWTYGFEWRQVRDLREARIESALVAEQGNDYVFGKLNSLSVLNPMVGMEWNIMPTSSVNLLNVRGGVRIGPIIGLLNPYQLDIRVCAIGGQNCTARSEAYDPTRHNFRNIIGRTSPTQTTFAPTVQMGVHLSTYVLADIAHAQHLVNALRFGAHLDAFPQAPPILAETTNRSNQSMLMTFSLALMFGTRW